jgi:hypothetical protein
VKRAVSRGCASANADTPCTASPASSTSGRVLRWQRLCECCRVRLRPGVEGFGLRADELKSSRAGSFRPWRSE